MKKTVKIILLAIAAVAVITGVIIKSTMPMDVATVVVNPKTAELSFTEQGVVLAQRHVEVYATIPGKITQLSAVEGQFVNQGAVLCRVDASQHEADLSRAREMAEKTASLYDSGFLSRQELTDAENMVKDLERVLTDTVIRAPVSGVVSLLNIKDTNVVSSQVPIAVINADRDCAVETFVSVKDMGAVKAGKRVVLVLEGRYANTEISGRVISAEDRAVVQISVLGVEERKVKVTIMPDDNSELKDGYEVDVRFSYYYEVNKLTVPKTAVFKENDRDMVWSVLDGMAYKIQIVPGMELRTEIVIEEGLSAGSIVIVDSNVKGLKDGVRIRGRI